MKPSCSFCTCVDMQTSCLFGSAHHFPGEQSVSECYAMMKCQHVCKPKSPDGTAKTFWVDD